MFERKISADSFSLFKFKNTTRIEVKVPHGRSFFHEAVGKRSGYATNSRGVFLCASPKNRPTR